MNLRVIENKYVKDLTSKTHNSQITIVSSALM